VWGDIGFLAISHAAYAVSSHQWARRRNSLRIAALIPTAAEGGLNASKNKRLQLKNRKYQNELIR
jgi:hypothetical protein